MSAVPSPPAPDELARLTLDLVSIPSPSGEEAAIAAFVERQLRDRAPSAAVTRSGNAVLARFPAATPGPAIILAGHLDTVPEADHPAPARIADDVVGLGATDMKGALAVMLVLAERMHARPADAPAVTLVFYDNEETVFARNGLRRVLAEAPDLGDASLALLLEPTGNELELGCLGTMSARVTFHGVAAHSARPWLGRNAIHAAGDFLAALARRSERVVTQGPAEYREVLSATLAEGGRARNVVPDRFTVTLNFRFAPDRSEAEAEAALRAEMPAGTTVEIVDSAPAAPARADAPALRALMDRYHLSARAKQAWTDAAQFAALGVPAANFGPGLPALAHTRDERVPVANLVRCYEVLADYLAAPRSAGRSGRKE